MALGAEKIQEFRESDREPAPKGAWRLFWFVFSILIILVVSYLGLIFGYQNYVEAQIEKREETLAALAEQVPEVQQQNFLAFQQQLSALKNLLAAHVTVSHALAALE
ncbi:MAG: hypothetical protein HY536_00735, partial [Candidatus Colwellbacteria bacterium]|nr:hypothetical protein [Candidatus Colwellbacteria bacterium]